ncbi:MAG: hypothetical protein R3E10_07085 [Gemmatimonadota bacterium]
MTSPLDEHSRDRGMGDISQRPDLARLRESPPPPAALEDRVVASLKARGWLGPRRGGRRAWLAQAGALAAATAGFLLGRAIPGRSAPAPATTGPRWMLLLYEDDGYQAPAPGAESERVQEYVHWARTLTDDLRAVEGSELGPERVVVAPALAEAPSQSGPAAERLSGYFVISAASMDDARGVAETCPHVRHGGRIVIRPLV